MNVDWIAVDAGTVVADAVVVVAAGDKLSSFEVSAFVAPGSPSDCAVCPMHPIVGFPTTNDRKNL